MLAQIQAFFGSAFSKYQCRFRKSYSTQHCLWKMLEKMEQMCQQKKSFRCFFDCLKQELLTESKLKEY